ncbi:cytolytic toxin-alpha-like [Danio aesculapii]|uniref:cytolytic toxin-alpha-like n=1 Tax=Danio aesculapii TaxID=1142201 RepID=UPI0024BF894B|nr:cytolytic toxin-alpha-like [Danio aesculapii]
MAAGPIELVALGRSMFPGMLYDCRKDSFIPGVTLWNKKSMNDNLDTHPQPRTDLKFSGSDSLSDKCNLMDISASLKASFFGGLVEVGGSAKYLHDTKTSNQQSRVTMYYSETTRFDQLIISQLQDFSYPQVFKQKTATHVITAVLYGAQAFMVFDRTLSSNENIQDIEGELNVMIKKIPSFSIEGKGSVQMTDNDKKTAENISCTFHGDFHLEQNPTSYMEALDIYQKLPTLLKENPQNAIPIKVWLYPLHLLNDNVAKLMREISSGLVSKTVDIIEKLNEVNRVSSDLSKNTLTGHFSNIQERLSSFQESVGIYKMVFQKAVARVLPDIRGGVKEEGSLADILKIHHDSPFNAGMLNQWLKDAKSELHLLSSYMEMLGGIKLEDSDGLSTILLDPDIDVVVCLTITSLSYEDPDLKKQEEFLKSDQFKKLDGANGHETDVEPVRKWFNNPDAIRQMRESLTQFRSFSLANKDDKRICFIVSAISDSSNPVTSIYLYEKGDLKNTKFQLPSKPPPPIVKDVQDETVSLKLQKPSTGKRVKYRVEYKESSADSAAEENWLVINTPDEDFILTGLEAGKLYLIRYRTVSEVGVSEVSDIISTEKSSANSKPIGGKDGAEFNFITSSHSISLKEISITYTETSLNSIQVTFSCGNRMQTGNVNGPNEIGYTFDDSKKIVAATLWPNKDQNKLGGLELEFDKGQKFSCKCDQLGDAVSVDVKSGICYGITGRSDGSEIIALGLYFI